ncbi:DUF5753 domain-containing protein [Streptomyces sp. NPDC088261]|uniref:DUF5753 domain-containing protein n=1 Tax=Streptomyces sp. NPDC088261 TaxID=3365851 RepID=UPI0038171A47
MSVNTSAMVARQRFGDAIQQLRLKARAADGQKIKQIDAAKALRRKTVDRVSRIERGAAWPTEAELTALLSLYEADLATRVQLETMLREGTAIEGAWWTSFSDEFHESLMEFIAYEDAASKIISCAGSLVPGLFQTSDYGRTITTALTRSALSPHAMERSVELRRNRRGIFDRNRPPEVEVIIGEGALRHEVGGRKIMTRQLDSLIEDGTERHVTFRVVPFTAPASFSYVLSLFEFGGANERPLGAVDAMAGMSFRKDPREMRELRGFVDALREISLSPSDSLEKMRTLRKEMSRD